MEENLIKISNLKKYYLGKNRTVKALDGISLDIYKGEIWGLLGVNGAGKTTLSSILATLHPATDGEVIFNNFSIYKDINFYRMHVGYCPQKSNLINELSVKQNLVLAGKYYSIPDKIIKERLEFFIEKYQLKDFLSVSPSVLSGGYRQRVIIARALMHNPSLLILDEPTVALDPHIRVQLWDTIRELKKSGVTVILTTHYLDEAEVLSDRICILDKGKIKLIDTPANLNLAYDKERLEDVFLQLLKEETE